MTKLEAMFKGTEKAKGKMMNIMEKQANVSLFIVFFE